MVIERLLAIWWEFSNLCGHPASIFFISTSAVCLFECFLRHVAIVTSGLGATCDGECSELHGAPTSHTAWHFAAGLQRNATPIAAITSRVGMKWERDILKQHGNIMETIWPSRVMNSYSYTQYMTGVGWHRMGMEAGWVWCWVLLCKVIAVSSGDRAACFVDDVPWRWQIR